jgi:sec-independent protein translocase protein TatA
MPHIGMPELIIIALVVILLFGASRLPELAKSVGVSRKEFKKATRDAQEDAKDAQQAEAPDSGRGWGRQAREATRGIRLLISVCRLLSGALSDA